MRRIRRLAAAMAIAAAGLTLAPAAIGSVSAWGDSTICYAGQTYTFDNEPAYYAFLDAHPGATEGTCATTTTTTAPPPSSTTTTLPDVDETTTTTAPPEGSTTTTAPADDTTTTTTTVAVDEPPVPPAHAVADLCGEIRIDLSGYQAGDALTVVTDDGTFVTLIDESGALRIGYLSTQHYRVTVAAEPGGFDTGTRDSYCYVPPTTGEPATPIIHDEPATTTTAPAAPAPAAPPSPGLPETGFPIGGTLAAGTGALLAGIGLTRLNARRRPRTA